MSLNPSQFQQTELLSYEEKGPWRMYTGDAHGGTWESDPGRASHAGTLAAAERFAKHDLEGNPGTAPTLHVVDVDPRNAVNTPQRPASDLAANNAMGHLRGSNVGFTPNPMFQRPNSPTFDDNVPEQSDKAVFYRNASADEDFDSVAVTGPSDKFSHVASQRLAPDPVPSRHLKTGDQPRLDHNEMEAAMAKHKPIDALEYANYSRVLALTDNDFAHAAQAAPFTAPPLSDFSSTDASGRDIPERGSKHRYAKLDGWGVPGARS